MATTDTLAVTVSSKALTLVEKACEAMAALDVASSRAAFPYPEAPLIKDIMRQLCETLVETNEALAACQSQAAGRIRVLEAALAQALENIKVWHNMGGADDVWPIYFRSAPEMRLIREALPPCFSPNGRTQHGS